MSEHDALSQPTLVNPRPRWRRRLLWVVLTLVAVLAGGCFLVSYLVEEEWRDAVAEADRLDPGGWQLDDLEAARAAVPDDRNAALRVLAAQKLLPTGWPTWPTDDGPALDLKFDDVPPPTQLSPPQTRALAAVLADARPALAEARRLSDLPTGRYPITYSQDFISTARPYLDSIRALTPLLSFDVLLRAQEADADGALASCRALLNLGRSLGDEPGFFPQWRRIELRIRVCRKLERALAQGQPSEAALAELQRLLQDEEAQPVALIAARGERAGWIRLLSSLNEGTSEAATKGRRKSTGENLLITGLAYTGLSQRAAILRANTQVVELARRPVEEQFANASALKYTLPGLGAMYFQPKMEKVNGDLFRGYPHSQVELRCAIVGLAAERYRRARGSWPAALADLVPGYFTAVPTDPADGRPLRCERLPDGIRIHSLATAAAAGPRSTGLMGTHLAFRLWDVPHRHQPPKVPAPPAAGPR
jgi:hypothetical protein